MRAGIIPGLFFIILLFSVGCDCDCGGGDDDDNTVIVIDDTDSPDDTSDDTGDDTKDDTTDDTTDDTAEAACTTSSSYEEGVYYLPFRLTLTADCRAKIFYKRERSGGQGDADFIEAQSPVFNILIDRDTNLRFYSVNESDVAEEEQNIVFNFPPKFDGVYSAYAGNERITLQWDAAWDENNPITYNIYRTRTDLPIPSLTPVAQTADTQITITNAETDMTNGVGVCFVVRPSDSSGLETLEYTGNCLAPNPVFHVDVDAEDGGDGSIAHPFNSLQDANDALPDDRIGTNFWVAAGTYDESLDFTANDPPGMTTVHSAQVFGGFDPSDWSRDVRNNRTVVNGGGATAAWKPGELDLIEGIYVTGAQNGFLLSDRMSLTIRNCVAHGNSNYGIMIEAHDIISGPTIVNTLIVENGNGIGLFAAPSGDSDSGIITFLRNNIIYGNTGDGVRAQAYTGGIYNVYLTARLHNAIVMDNGRGFSGDISGADILAEAQIFNTFIGDNDTDLTCSGCPAEMMSILYSDILDPGSFTGEYLMSVAPGFADPPADFRLTENSLLIDAGCPDPQFDDPNLTRNDVGVFGGPSGIWQPLTYP